MKGYSQKKYNAIKRVEIRFDIKKTGEQTCSPVFSMGVKKKEKYQY